MSLSAAEKVRVVHALDALGVGLIEAGFPGSNPKERELFELLAGEELEQAAICAFGMTRRRGVDAAEDESLAALAASFAPVVTLVGKTWGLHLDVVTKVSREENLAMIGESVGFCSVGGQAGRLRRRALLRRLARRSRLRARVRRRSGRIRCRERDALRHQRLQPPARDRRGDRRRRPGPRRQGQRRDPHPQRRRVRGGQLDRGGAGRRGPRPGDGQRLRRAHRQRQPDLDPAGAPAQARLRLRRPGAARAADGHRAPGRRDLQRHAPIPTSPSSGATPSRTRAGCTPPRWAPTRGPSSTWSRRPSATAARS